MLVVYLWRFLHLLFAFSFVGALTIAEWNARAACATADWNRRAALWGVVRVTTQVLGLGALLLLGIFGNLLAVSKGLPMGGHWMLAVNGLWLAGVLLHLLVALPTVRRLVSACESAARTQADPPAHEPAAGVAGPGRESGPGSAAEYTAALARWRIANLLLSIFFGLMLVLMVLRPAFW
jgi:uncharacterized membrane protein